MAERNKRPLFDDGPSPNREPSSANKADNKATPTKQNANMLGSKMMETDNMDVLATTMATDLSLIQQEDSIWSSNTNDKDDLSDGTEAIQFEDLKDDNETLEKTILTDEQVQDILQNFGKIGFVTHNDDDSVLQALANFFGYQLLSANLDKDLLKSFIIAHQEWFKNHHNEIEKLDIVHYKILAKCIGIPNKRFKKLSNSELFKKKVTKKFLSIDANQEYSVAHVQHLSKINGIFFPKGTISDSGKQSFITRMINAIDLNKHSIVSPDKYSTQKILGFISNSKKVNHTIKQLRNPYAKQSQSNNNTSDNDITPASQLTHNDIGLGNSHVSIRTSTITEQATANQTNQPDATATTTQRQDIPANTNNTTQPNLTNTITTVIGGTPDELEIDEEMQNETIATKFSRIELRLCMHPNENENGDVNQLRRHIHEALQQLLLVDPHIRIWSWYERSLDSSLDINNIPQDIRSINRYFNRLSPSQYGMVHGEFRMEHSRRWEDISHDLTPWLSDNRHGMYYQHLQCPSTTNLGWLLWSFRKIDVAVLQMELLLNHGINVTLRYQNIVLNRGRTPANERVMALHVISDKTEADRVAARLKELYPYGKEIPSFPLGIVMRFIPHIFRVKRDKFQKITQLRARQGNFLTAIENPARPMNATSWEILTIDTNRATFGTLRSRIMEISPRDRPNDKLFLSVDTSYFRSNEVIFTFLPRNETEAREFVTNIVPFFLHSYDENTLATFFHSEAIMRAKSINWNMETREIESADDAYLNNGREDIDDFDNFEPMGAAEASGTTNYNPQIDRVELFLHGYENDSIGTLFTNNQQRMSNTSPSSQLAGQLQTPTTQHNRNGITPSNSSIGGQSLGTTFTNEEATNHILLLTDGYRNLELMFMAVMQQQGIPIPTLTRRHNVINNTPIQHDINNSTTNTEGSNGPSDDRAMQDNQLELVDPNITQIDQEQS